MRYDLTAGDERLRQALVPEYEKPRTKEKKPLCRPSSPVYLAGGALFAAIASFGLFLGFFLPSPLGALIAGGEPIFNGSLFGTLVEILRGSIAPPPLSAGGILGAVPFLLYCACLALAFGVLLSSALAAAAFVRIKAARMLCHVNGTLVFLTYTVLFLLGALGGTADLSAALPALSAAALLAILALLRRGAEGIFRVLLLACSLFSAGAFIFPASPLLSALGGLFPLTAKSGCLLALMGVTALNLFLSVLLCSARGGGWDIFRFALQTASALALSAVSFNADGAAFFTASPAAFALLLLPPLAGLLLSVACRALFPRTRLKKEEAGDRADPS